MSPTPSNIKKSSMVFKQVWCTRHLTRHLGVTFFKMVTLDPVLHHENVTPWERGFPNLKGRNWKVGLDENTGCTWKYLSNGNLCPCLYSLITWEVEGRVFSPPAPLSIISGYGNKEENISVFFLVAFVFVFFSLLEALDQKEFFLHDVVCA